MSWEVGSQVCAIMPGFIWFWGRNPEIEYMVGKHSTDWAPSLTLIFHFIDMTHFLFILFWSDRQLPFFHFPAMNIDVFCVDAYFNFPEKWTIWVIMVTPLTHLRSCQSALPNWLHHFTLPQQVQFFHILRHRCWYFVFLILAILVICELLAYFSFSLIGGNKAH